METITVDVCYVIHSGFYFGPEEGTLEQWQKLREPLAAPNIPLQDGFLLSGNVVGREKELIEYYGNILKLSRKHNKNPENYFWLRPVLFKEGEWAFTFPWYDTLREVDNLFSNLQAKGPGEVFGDEDQGWCFEAYVEGGRLYLRESNPDAEERDYELVVSVPHSMVIGQMSQVLSRVKHQIGLFTERFGADYWSKLRLKP